MENHQIIPIGVFLYGDIWSRLACPPDPLFRIGGSVFDNNDDQMEGVLATTVSPVDFSTIKNFMRSAFINAVYEHEVLTANYRGKQHSGFEGLTLPPCPAGFNRFWRAGMIPATQVERYRRRFDANQVYLHDMVQALRTKFDGPLMPWLSRSQMDFLFYEVLP